VSWKGPRVGQHERLSCLWCRGGARQLGVSPVKPELTGDPGCAFYINEYRDVLVPDTSSGGSVYAGNYTRDLEFDYNGTPITPRPPQGLSPGDPARACPRHPLGEPACAGLTYGRPGSVGRRVGLGQSAGWPAWVNLPAGPLATRQRAAQVIADRAEAAPVAAAGQLALRGPLTVAPSSWQ